MTEYLKEIALKLHNQGRKSFAAIGRELGVERSVARYYVLSEINPQFMEKRRASGRNYAKKNPRTKEQKLRTSLRAQARLEAKEKFLNVEKLYEKWGVPTVRRSRKKPQPLKSPAEDKRRRRHNRVKERKHDHDLVVQYFKSGMGVSEVAAKMNISYGAAKSLKRRLLAKGELS